MGVATAQFPAAVWDGTSETRDAPVVNINKAPDYEDWDQMVAEIQATQTEVNGGLDGINVNTVANVNVVGGIPIVHQINIADSAGDTDVVFTHKTRITDVTVVKTTGAGSSGDTVTVKKGSTAITNAMDMNVADKAVVRAGTIDDAQHEIAAAGTLKVTAAKAGNVACIVYVHGYRVA